MAQPFAQLCVINSFFTSDGFKPFAGFEFSFCKEICFFIVGRNLKVKHSRPSGLIAENSTAAFLCSMKSRPFKVFSFQICIQYISESDHCVLIHIICRCPTVGQPFTRFCGKIIPLLAVGLNQLQGLKYFVLKLDRLSTSIRRQFAFFHNFSYRSAAAFAFFYPYKLTMYSILYVILPC